MGKDFKTENCIPIDIDRSNWNNEIFLLKDAFTGEVYLINSNWGKVDLYTIEPRDRDYKHLVTIDGYLNMEKPQIYKDKLYFLYLTKTYPSIVTLFSRQIK